MKLYRGRKRQAKKLAKEHACYYNVHELDPWKREVLDYLEKAKPGDIIGACTGRNHVIEKIDYMWVGKKTKVLHDIRITDTEGHWHWFSGSG